MSILLFIYIPPSESFTSLDLFYCCVWFLLNYHKYPKDNQSIKLFVFNILLVGRRFSGKRR